MAEQAGKKYIVAETVVSMLFNSAFSFGFTWLFFRSQPLIDTSALVSDALPQSFFVTFFGVLMPTLITRHRLRKGKIVPMGAKQWRIPTNALLRAILFGVLMAIAGGVAHYFILNTLNLGQVELGAVLVYKTLYGAFLSWLVTPLALFAALNEGSARR